MTHSTLPFKSIREMEKALMIKKTFFLLWIELCLYKNNYQYNKT